MSREALQETLSAVMDNEADELELRRVLAACGEDAELRSTWSRYQLARSVMHREPTLPKLDIAAAVSAALADEAAPPKAEKGPWRMVGRLAVAASVTLAVLAGVRLYNQNDALPQMAQQGTTPQIALPQVKGPAVLAGYSEEQGAPQVITNSSSSCSAVAVLARIWKINDAVEMAPEDAQPIEYQRKLTRRGLGFTQARSSQTGGIASASQHPKYLQALAGRTSEYPTWRRLAQVARLSCAPNRHGTPGSSLRTYHPVLAEGH